VWTEAERSRGQAWGVETVRSFHTYGTPVVNPDAPRLRPGGA
jgi:catechol 2,3-dioxygenase